MLDDDKSKMKQEERDAVFVELIKEVGWVFHHPILREWVTVAPSVNSIDAWISKQFDGFERKIDLIKAMRKAVRVWDLVKDSQTRKNLLKTPKDWRLSEIFMLEDETDYPGQYSDSESLSFATGIRFLPYEEGIIDCSNWPRLLREFGHKLGPHGFKTSLDELSSAHRFYSPKTGLDEEFWYHSRVSESVRTRPDEINELGYKLDFKQKSLEIQGPIAWFHMIFQNFGVDSQIIQVAPEKGETYPRFYKIIQFHDRNLNRLDPRVNIRIVWPIDCCGREQTGKLSLQKSFRLHDQMETFLDVSYRFGSKFELVFDPEHVSYNPHSMIHVRISSVQPSLLFQEVCPAPKAERVAETTGKLFDDFLKIWEASVKSGGKRIALDSIIGDRIFRNPPQNLLKVFIGEDPDFREYT